ncbi:MAG: SIMPL domain-containing protein [Cyclobacteriaceae bacterium]
MKHSLIILFAFLSTISFGQTGEKNFIDQNYIEVTGTAEMSVVPDLIYIKIIISEKDTKNKISVDEMERKMIAKLQEIGIDVKKDLSISDLLSAYKSKMLAKSDVILSKRYQLIIHDAPIADRVFSELEKVDISNVSIDRMDHSKIEDFRRETKSNAIKVAKEKAELLTKSIGQNIGRAIYIEELHQAPFDENSNRIAIRGTASRALGYSLLDEKEIVYDFEKIKLKYSILVRFELK